MRFLAALALFALAGSGSARGHRRLGNGIEGSATRELRRVEGKNGGKGRGGGDKGDDDGG